MNAFTQQSISDTIAITEIVITASKNETARRNVPLTISFIKTEEIEQSDESAILPFISERTPGLFVTERGILGFGVSTGAAGQISIRGTGGSPTTQVLILIDGHPQVMGIMGHTLPDAYVTSDAEKVEVIRGPASILYGSNAMGGVINIITRQQKADGFNVNSRVAYGSYNTQKYTLSGGFRKKGFTLFGSVNHGSTDGHRDSSEFSITNGYLKAGYVISNKIKLTADVNIADYHTRDPGKAGSIAGVKMNILRGSSSLSVDNSFKNTEGSVKFYQNFGDHDFTDGWRSHDGMYGLMVYQVVKPFQGNTITVGYDYMTYNGKGSPITKVLRDENGNIIPGENGPQFQLSEYSDQWISMHNHGVYTFIQQQLLQKFTLTAGLRYEYNSIFGGEFIPQGGFAFYPGINSTLRGSVSKGYRPPSLRELYLFPTANDELKPENILNAEIGWDQQWLSKKINTILTLFFLTGDNLIVKNPPAPPPPPLYKNTGEISNMGIEFSTDIKPLEGLTIHANYAYIHMKNPVTGTPEHNFFINPTYKVWKFHFSAKMQYVCNLYGENATGLVDVIEKSYVLLGIKTSFSIIDKMLECYISGDNLLNQDYQHMDGYPNPGIHFMGGIHFKFAR
ncbi:MAG: TonB-dependent receptor [Bacteroidales bacterium]|nr:TonB-dependent receptor [Bacteroidales bacterium]